MGTLYVVATPIGNLEDISARARRVLNEVAVIAAEDTRVTRKLLARIEVSTPLVSWHMHSKRPRLDRILSVLQTSDVALVTDAGAPGVSDPGAVLVTAAIDAGHSVVPVPGPSAVTAALGVSGLPADRFLFLGFLPRKTAERHHLLESATNEQGSIVCFETPHRLTGALKDIEEIWPERRIVVCRELTKIHEELFRGTATEALAHFGEPRGEFVLVIEGAGEAAPALDDGRIAETLAHLRAAGHTGRNLVDAAVKETGAARSRVYRIALERDKDESRADDSNMPKGSS